MELLASFFRAPMVLGATVFIPIFLFIICLIVRIKPVMALKTSFSVGFCMVGMSLMVSRFGQMLGDMASLSVRETSALQIADAGRQAAMKIGSITQEVVFPVMLIAVLLNLVMLLTRCTRTISIDLWSFWLYSLVCALVQSLTGNLVYGYLAAALAVVFTLVMADSSVKGVEKCCAFSGITLVNASTAACAPIAGAICWINDKIPYKGRKDITFGWLQKRIGYLGDPVLLGTLAAAAISLGYGGGVVQSLQTAMQVGAMIFITPKIMLLLGDAIKPLTIGLGAFSTNKLGLHGSLTIGLSSSLGLGNPTAMLFSVLMVPTTVWLAGVLPNVMFVPSIDFAYIPYLIIMLVAICRGGILKTAISCVASMVLMLYSATNLGGLFTQAAVAADQATYSSMGMVSSLYGSSPLNWGISIMASFGIAGAGMLIVSILALCLWNYNKLTGNVKIYVKKQKTFRTFAIESIKEETERRRELRKSAVSEKRQNLRKAVESDRMARQEGLEPEPAEPAEQMTIFPQQDDEPDEVSEQTTEQE